MSEDADYKRVRNSTVGAELTEDEAKLLAAKMGIRHLKDGEFLVKEGECAGTRAFVEQSPRKATLRALGDAMVYTLTPEDFESLLVTHPRAAFKVMRALFRVTHANLSRMNQESEQLSNYITKSHGRY